MAALTTMAGRGDKGVGPRVLLVLHNEIFLLSHRLPLALAVRDVGCRLTVAASIEEGKEGAIKEKGLDFQDIRLLRSKRGPVAQFAQILELYRLYRRERPDLVHHVAIRPVLYGSLAARLARVPAVINSVTGLGYTFLQGGFRGRLLKWAVSQAYRVSLSPPRFRVILQNPDDVELFVQMGIVLPEQVRLIRGAGVDVTRFAPAPEPPGVPRLLLGARMLWDKGIGELVDAGKILKARGVSCEILLAGAPDPLNPRSIPQDVLRGWHREGSVHWIGQREDMDTLLRESHIAVLPSYREGAPLFLLEAAASGRPIVAADVPGCREVVRHMENGLLVAPRDPEALAGALEVLIRDRDLRHRMGEKGRERAVNEFSVGHINGMTLAVYKEALREKWPDTRNCR